MLLLNVQIKVFVPPASGAIVKAVEFPAGFLTVKIEFTDVVDLKSCNIYKLSKNYNTLPQKFILIAYVFDFLLTTSI